MRVEVDRDFCQGNGESLSPEMFEVGEDGLAHVEVDAVPVELRAAAIAAVASCPNAALRVVGTTED